MTLSRIAKERIIENYLIKYTTYKIGLKNCKKQLDYMMPSLTSYFDSNGMRSTYFIANNTEQVALDRITSKKALDLLEEIEQFNLIIACIDNAVVELDEKQREFVKLRYFKGMKIYQLKTIMAYAEEKSIYRIRKQVLDKFLISLHNLISLK